MVQRSSVSHGNGGRGGGRGGGGGTGASQNTSKFQYRPSQQQPPAARRIFQGAPSQQQPPIYPQSHVGASTSNLGIGTTTNNRGGGIMNTNNYSSNSGQFAKPGGSGNPYTGTTHSAPQHQNPVDESDPFYDDDEDEFEMAIIATQLEHKIQNENQQQQPKPQNLQNNSSQHNKLSCQRYALQVQEGGGVDVNDHDVSLDDFGDNLRGELDDDGRNTQTNVQRKLAELELKNSQLEEHLNIQRGEVANLRRKLKSDADERQREIANRIKRDEELKKKEAEEKSTVAKEAEKLRSELKFAQQEIRAEKEKSEAFKKLLQKHKPSQASSNLPDLSSMNVVFGSQAASQSVLNSTRSSTTTRFPTRDDFNAKEVPVPPKKPKIINTADKLVQAELEPLETETELNRIKWKEQVKEKQEILHVIAEQISFKVNYQYKKVYPQLLQMAQYAQEKIIKDLDIEGFPYDCGFPDSLTLAEVVMDKIELRDAWEKKRGERKNRQRDKEKQDRKRIARRKLRQERREAGEIVSEDTPEEKTLGEDEWMKNDDEDGRGKDDEEETESESDIDDEIPVLPSQLPDWNDIDLLDDRIEPVLSNHRDIWQALNVALEELRKKIQCIMEARNSIYRINNLTFFIKLLLWIYNLWKHFIPSLSESWRSKENPRLDFDNQIRRWTTIILWLSRACFVVDDVQSEIRRLTLKILRQMTENGYITLNMTSYEKFYKGIFFTVTARRILTFSHFYKSLLIAAAIDRRNFYVEYLCANTNDEKCLARQFAEVALYVYSHERLPENKFRLYKAYVNLLNAIRFCCVTHDKCATQENNQDDDPADPEADSEEYIWEWGMKASSSCCKAPIRHGRHQSPAESKNISNRSKRSSFAASKTESFLKSSMSPMMVEEEEEEDDESHNCSKSFRIPSSSSASENSSLSESDGDEDQNEVVDDDIVNASFYGNQEDDEEEEKEEPEDTEKEVQNTEEEEGEANKLNTQGIFEEVSPLDSAPASSPHLYHLEQYDDEDDADVLELHPNLSSLCINSGERTNSGTNAGSNNNNSATNSDKKLNNVNTQEGSQKQVNELDDDATECVQILNCSLWEENKKGPKKNLCQCRYYLMETFMIMTEDMIDYWRYLKSEQLFAQSSPWITPRLKSHHGNQNEFEKLFKVFKKAELAREKSLVVKTSDDFEAETRLLNETPFFKHMMKDIDHRRYGLSPEDVEKLLEGAVQIMYYSFVTSVANIISAFGKEGAAAFYNASALLLFYNKALNFTDETREIIKYLTIVLECPIIGSGSNENDTNENNQTNQNTTSDPYPLTKDSPSMSSEINFMDLPQFDEDNEEIKAAVPEFVRKKVKKLLQALKTAQLSPKQYEVRKRNRNNINEDNQIENDENNDVETTNSGDSSSDNDSDDNNMDDMNWIEKFVRKCSKYNGNSKVVQVGNAEQDSDDSDVQVIEKEDKKNITNDSDSDTVNEDEEMNEKEMENVCTCGKNKESVNVDDISRDDGENIEDNNSTNIEGDTDIYDSEDEQSDMFRNVTHNDYSYHPDSSDNEGEDKWEDVEDYDEFCRSDANFDLPFMEKMPEFEPLDPEIEREKLENEIEKSKQIRRNRTLDEQEESLYGANGLPKGIKTIKEMLEELKNQTTRNSSISKSNEQTDPKVQEVIDNSLETLKIPKYYKTNRTRGLQNDYVYEHVPMNI